MVIEYFGIGISGFILGWLCKMVYYKILGSAVTIEYKILRNEDIDRSYRSIDAAFEDSELENMSILAKLGVWFLLRDTKVGNYARNKYLEEYVREKDR